MKLLGLLTLLIPMVSWAAADCPAYAKEEWASEEILKQTLIDEGYAIKKFKIDGHCYEMYGRNKEGKRVEIYFDMKTLAIVKAIGLKD